MIFKMDIINIGNLKRGLYNISGGTIFFCGSGCYGFNATTGEPIEIDTSECVEYLDELFNIEYDELGLIKRKLDIKKLEVDLYGQEER